jgi:hypothetical protein
LCGPFVGLDEPHPGRRHELGSRARPGPRVARTQGEGDPERGEQRDREQRVHAAHREVIGEHHHERRADAALQIDLVRIELRILRDAASEEERMQRRRADRAAQGDDPGAGAIATQRPVPRATHERAHRPEDHPRDDERRQDHQLLLDRSAAGVIEHHLHGARIRPPQEAGLAREQVEDEEREHEEPARPGPEPAPTHPLDDTTRPS